MPARGSAPRSLIQLLPVDGNDPQAIQGPGPGGMDHLEPFRAAEGCQARLDRPEVPQPEPGEIRRFPVTNINSVKAAAAGIDAALLPVADDPRGRPVQRARWLPPARKEFCSDTARDRALRQHDAVKPD